MNKFQVCIIGGGPAGSAAALQLTRLGLSCIMFEKESIGGLLRQANIVENYIGFPNGVRGQKLCSLIKSQIDNADVEYLIEEVINIDKNELFEIKTIQRSVFADYLILATGTEALVPDDVVIPNDLTDKVFTEVSHLEGVSDKVISILGSGDAAFDYALNLSRANTVNIFSRSNYFKALPLLIDRAKSNTNINLHTNVILTNINSFNKEILLNCKVIHGELNINSDYLLFAIGRKPRLNLLDGKANLLENDNCYLIGDACNGDARQSAIAAGNGIQIAMHIYFNLCKEYDGNCS